MPFLGTEAPSLEDVEWINSEPGMGAGTFLLNFWRSGCMECLDMLEQLEEIHRSHPGLEVIGLHVPGLLGRDMVEAKVRESGVSQYIGHDTGRKAVERYGSREGLFLLHDGELVWQKTPGNSFRHLKDTVDELTGEPVELETGEESTEDVYLGQARGEPVNDEENFSGEKEFEFPDNRMFERVYLDGKWNRAEEFLEAVDGRLVIHQRSAGTGLVASPGSGISDIEVTMDGEPVPGNFAGDDLRIEESRSYIRVSSRRIYSIIKGQKRRFELGLEPGEGTRIHKLSFR